MGLTAFDYLVMVIYIVIMFAIGIYLTKKQSRSDDYLLGGRSMPAWAVGISMLLALFSTVSLVACPGEVYNNGLTLPVFSTIVSPIFFVISFFLFVRFYFRVKTLTPFEYLEHRFDHRVRLVGSSTFWLIRLMYLGTVLYSSAKVLEGAANSPTWLTIVIIGFIGTLMTTIGGMKAVIWTNVFQFFVLIVGLGWILIKCINAVPGGIPGIISYNLENGRGFEAVYAPDFFSFSPYVRLSFWVLLLSTIYTAIFSYSSDQLGIGHLLSTSSYKQAKRSFFVFLVVTFIISIPLYFIGMAMFAFYGHNVSERPHSGDTAMFHFIGTQLSSPGAGLVISAMLAAVLSTLDAGISCLAAVSMQDIYLRHFKPTATQQEQVNFSKVITIVLGLLAVAISLVIASVSTGLGETFIEVGAIWMAFSSVLPPMYLVGVTTTRVNARHVMTGVLLGWAATIVMIVWYTMTRGTDHSVSFLWTSVAGSVVMTIWCYIPVILRFKQVDSNKTDGLTLWTLGKGLPVNDESKSVERIVSV